jgi:Uma2 family endonuclease
MADPARRRATYQDLLALPEHVVGEIIDGELRTMPRPAPRHAAAATALGEELGPPFKRGRGGPGGWILLDEPELHLGEDVLVPDLAGWRRERMPLIPADKPYVTLAPDWACEVLSPSTAKTDRAEKLPIYAREKVGDVWLIDPAARTLEVLRREGRFWIILDVQKDQARVRAEPFDAIELDLAVLWADVAPPT